MWGARFKTLYLRSLLSAFEIDDLGREKWENSGACRSLSVLSLGSFSRASRLGNSQHHLALASHVVSSIIIRYASAHELSGGVGI